MFDSELVKVVQQLCQQLQVCQLQLVTAESCTGGLLASMLTSIEGSSAWFERGFVTYSNQAKQEILQVPASILQAHGAVSWQAAVAMAEGALQASHSDMAVAITGIAGPTGGSADKPVGQVFFAWAGRNAPCTHLRASFHGERRAIQQQAVIFAMQQTTLRLVSTKG